MMPVSLFKKSILQHASRSLKAREMVQRKTVGGGGLPGNYLIVQSKIPKCEVYLVEEIRQEELQNKVVIAQAILPLRGKILNVEKAMHPQGF
jgi:DNA gyrase subunit B